jgi:hypothetical protein
MNDKYLYLEDLMMIKEKLLIIQRLANIAFSSLIMMGSPVQIRA